MEHSSSDLRKMSTDPSSLKHMSPKKSSNRQQKKVRRVTSMTTLSMRPPTTLTSMMPKLLMKEKQIAETAKRPTTYFEHKRMAPPTTSTILHRRDKERSHISLGKIFQRSSHRTRLHRPLPWSNLWDIDISNDDGPIGAVYNPAPLQVTHQDDDDEY